jgi:hypothetical protein
LLSGGTRRKNKTGNAKATPSSPHRLLERAGAAGFPGGSTATVAAFGDLDSSSGMMSALTVGN